MTAAAAASTRRGGPGPAPYRAPRVRFMAGAAVAGPPGRARPGWLAPTASVISTGTELRHLAATKSGPSKDAGYMAIAADGTDLLVAAAPHGALICREHPELLRVPIAVGVNRLAAARFALIGSLGIDLLPADVLNGEVLLIGSGPVAVGCALELLRRGVDRIQVLTRRPFGPIAAVPRVEIVTGTGPAWCVIDAAGRLDVALAAVSDGGTLGLLATPDPAASVPALAMHRRGLTTVGMHELASYDHWIYDNRLGAIAQWLCTALPEDLIDSWCLRVPGEQALAIFDKLAGGHRPIEPFITLEWTP